MEGRGLALTQGNYSDLSEYGFNDILSSLTIQRCTVTLVGLHVYDLVWPQCTKILCHECLGSRAQPA
jgi:hypothetical protein